MNSEDVMVAGIEDHMRGQEHFNETFLSVVREASGFYMYICICPRKATLKNEYPMKVETNLK